MEISYTHSHVAEKRDGFASTRVLAADSQPLSREVPWQANFSHKTLRYNSLLSKPARTKVALEGFVGDAVFLLVTVLFGGLAILYLRACERLK